MKHFTDFLDRFGFYILYRLVCLGRTAAVLGQWMRRVWLRLLWAVLRPPALALMRARDLLPQLLVPVLGAAAFAGFVQFWLHQPFVLRVEVNGVQVGYVASEQDFDEARADVQARVRTARTLLEAAGKAVPDWEVEPTFTLAVSADTMTAAETANAILQASGSGITAGTAVYIDGSLRYVTAEGDHLRAMLAAARRPWLDSDPDSQVVFAHDLRLVDGIYLTGSVSPYRDIVAAPYGTEIYAADAGTVVACTRHWSWGNYVEIDHGNGYKTLYAHMSAQAVQVGDTVEQGQLIGYVGSTGVSSGNHCHFEMSYNGKLFSARDVFPDMAARGQ